MKAADNPDLAELIKRLEERNKRKQMGTTVVAALGLVGFGVMMVPILGSGPTRLAQTPPVVATTTPMAPEAFTNVSLIGGAAIVYDLSTGQTLFEKNAKAQLPLASLTKLLTTYAASVALDSNAPITISETALAAEGDSGLSAGETFAFKDLARYALVASSNDAAEAIAEAAAKKRDTSDRSLLANAAAAVGLTQTYALNGTGLDENTRVSGGYGSAEDIAKLAGALLTKEPHIARATTEMSVTVSDYQGGVHTLPNTNQGIGHLPNPLLSKTGFTDLAGGNLVVIFDVGINHPIAVVVLDSTKEGRFSDVDKLVGRTLSYFGGPVTSER
jgi:D-alanyl-D-alanine carboxypeptidase